MISAAHAARALGGDVIGPAAIACPGPGHSKRDRSLSILFHDRDFVCHSHAGDDWRACRDHVRAALGIGHAGAARPAVTGRNKAPAGHGDRSARALALWNEARPIRGTPAEKYLKSRGLDYDGGALRWHPRCPFGTERHGAMVALIRSIRTNAAQAIHRTALTPDGEKLGRKMLGPCAAGAVKLTDDADVETALAIGEGVETTLSIRRLPGLERMPVWACLSAGGIERFPVLPGIETLWIAVDRDASGAGERAASACAERCEAAGLEVLLLMPGRENSDLNDTVIADDKS